MTTPDKVPTLVLRAQVGALKLIRGDVAFLLALAERRLEEAVAQNRKRRKR